MKYATIKLLSDCKLLDFKLSDEDLKSGDLVLVHTGQIQEAGRIVNLIEKPENEIADGKIIRKLEQEDKEKLEELKKKALDYILFCSEKVTKLSLPMKIIDADLSYDEKKLTIYFSSEARVDFRALVGDFVRSFKKLIRLQQIGPREQAKKIGGCGKCGRVVCCNKFLKNLGSVTIEKAKNQNMGEVNINKINGLCGKLMCCLEYEEDLYKKLKIKLPKLGTKIKTDLGIGEVIKQNVLVQSVTVKLAKGERVEVKL